MKQPQALKLMGQILLSASLISLALALHLEYGKYLLFLSYHFVH